MGKESEKKEKVKQAIALEYDPNKCLFFTVKIFINSYNPYP